MPNGLTAVVVEFKGLRPGASFEPGVYQLVSLVPLYSDWMMARCSKTLPAGGAQAWECPLDPRQALAVQAMQDDGVVVVNLELLPPAASPAGDTGRYRAEFWCDVAEAAFPELAFAEASEEE
jgi:hypothetical protein